MPRVDAISNSESVQLGSKECGRPRAISVLAELQISKGALPLTRGDEGSRLRISSGSETAHCSLPSGRSARILPAASATYTSLSTAVLGAVLKRVFDRCGPQLASTRLMQTRLARFNMFRI